MNFEFSLSSCWCSHRHTDGYAMVREMVDLGFRRIELSHGVRISLVPGILKAVEEGLVEVGSTHNFCPLPPGVTQAAPNLFEPSASDHGEHHQWLRYTKKSIDFAAQVKARVVVCHLGSVKFWWFNPASKLRNFGRRHPTANIPEDGDYQELLAKCCAKLRKRMPPYWEQVKASINEVLAYAKERGVLLGFENREKFEELPLDADYKAFIESFPADAPIGYWHDVGHADLKQSMGLLDHKTHLEQMAPRQIGFHLHDVSAKGSDHQAIGSGRINFKMVSQFWRPEHVLVLELSPRLKPEEVAFSRKRVLELAAERG